MKVPVCSCSESNDYTKEPSIINPSNKQLDCFRKPGIWVGVRVVPSSGKEEGIELSQKNKLSSLIQKIVNFVINVIRLTYNFFIKKIMYPISYKAVKTFQLIENCIQLFNFKIC
jgi:hypothetical protein